MNELYFVKFQMALGAHTCVFLVTVPVAHRTVDQRIQEAEIKAQCALTVPQEWHVMEITKVCTTPDELSYFEPC